MARNNKPTESQRRNALEQLYRRYRHRVNATGFDVGYKWSDGKPTGDLCIRVHVTTKIPETELSEGELFPKEINGIPIDVMTGAYEVKNELGTERAEDGTTIFSGSGCRRALGGTGTIGAMAIDEKTGQTGVLSNWHVMTTYRGSTGDNIYSVGHSPQPIARLSQSMLSRHGDAAFATLQPGNMWMPTVRELNLNLSGVRNSRLGEVLTKFGRSTGLTRARVDGEGIYRINYRTGPSTWTGVEIEGFRLAPEDPANTGNIEISAPGDSGSVWVGPESGEVVGLHMAGEGSPRPEEEYALACNMTTVLQRLGLRLATVDDLIRSGTVEELSVPEFLSQSVANAPRAEHQHRGFSQFDQPIMGTDPDHQVAPFGGSGSFAESAPTAARPPMSVSGNIWAEYRATLRRVRGIRASVAVGIDDDARRYFGGGNLAADFRDIALRSPRFSGDGVVPNIPRLRREFVFRGVCIAIAEGYQELGYPVSA